VLITSWRWPLRTLEHQGSREPPPATQLDHHDPQCRLGRPSPSLVLRIDNV
jgi:hypothetical protein